MISPSFVRIPRSVASLTLAALCGNACVEAGIIITNEEHSGAGNSFPVSNTDLLQTSLGSVATTGSFGGFGGGTEAVLHDGLHGPSGAVGDGSNSAPSPGSQITFSLDLTASPLGYHLSEIDTIASWDTGRDGQQYSVQYSTSADPDTFLALATVPLFNPSQPAFDHAHTRIRLTDTGGVLATDVAKLRFTFTSFENNGTAYREIDVLGAAVPEPSQYAAVVGLALAGFGVWRRARR